MPDSLSPPDLANAVTSFCTLGAGLTTLLLARWVRPQPRRWRRVYAFLLLTGIPTLGWHGWGGEAWRVADVSTNLLLAWALQLAVLGDDYDPRFAARFGGLSAALNGIAVLWMGVESVSGVRRYVVDLGGFGGFHAGEAMLILDAFAVVALLFAKRERIPPAARPLLRAVVVCFLVGLGLASAAGSTVHGRVFSYHALWHVLGAFGFVFFWAFTHVRLECDPGLAREPQVVSVPADATGASA